jgi:hypothetical protein
MPWPPHAQSLVHRDRRRRSGEYDPENGDATAPFCSNIGGVVTPGDQREDEIRFVLHNFDDSGHTGIIFLEVEDDQTEVNIKVMEPGVMS